MITMVGSGGTFGRPYVLRPWAVKEPHVIMRNKLGEIITWAEPFWRPMVPTPKA